MAQNICAIIPARGGSQRLLRINIYPIWGKPMIVWAIEAAQKSRLITDVWVSSEDDEIKKIAFDAGAHVHHRDEALSQDHIFKMEAVREAAQFIEKIKSIDIFISLQANSPQITGDILDKAIEVLVSKGRDELISVNSDLMMNAAFRIMKSSYVYQKDLSTKMGVFICELKDIHTLEDVHALENSQGI